MQLFHYLGHMTYGDVDIHGSLELSTFFLLSGFCLTLRYGEEGLQGSYGKFILLRMTKYVDKSDLKVFLLAILSRLLPTYYIANILALLCRCVFGLLNLSEDKINLNILEPN